MERHRTTVQDTRCPSAATEVSIILIRLIILQSTLASRRMNSMTPMVPDVPGGFCDPMHCESSVTCLIPDFPINRGPQVFDGEVMHSMDYAAMDDDCAAEFIKGQRITVRRKLHQEMIINACMFTNVKINHNGVRHPCTLLFKTVHWTVPDYLHTLNFQALNRFTEFMVHKPREGFLLWLLALLLSPLVFNPIAGPIDMKPECIHPRIPQLSILGYAESPATLYTTEMRSMWLVHFLAGKFKLPTIREMEEQVMEWEKCIRRYACEAYKRICVTVLLQIYCNDQLCRDMGCNPRRKSWFLSELFSPYGPTDYANLTHPINPAAKFAIPSVSLMTIIANGPTNW
ncbi:hypothetical protein L1049_026625 [Liquidambar formosana]|uniref:Uncharacterized protein n=1 Tax=Liquidambar formosana TaxID=63359 RepID=A0AAP0R914_LIQFO